MDIEREYRVAHMCCSIGGGAKGFRKGSARVGSMRAKFRNIGGIDVVPSALADFEHMAGCKGTLLDLFSLDQYRAFHGKEPPPGWREATPADIHRAFGYERPHIVFMSMPCKGFSGLLAEKVSLSPKYQALNGLTLRGVWLLLEAYKDDPPEFLLFENVPRIATRGRWLLDQIQAIYDAYGYAWAETTHDCGELGGLGQSRKRFLMVARHREKVPPFLYEPPKRRLRGVGEVLEKLPLPGDPAAGPMHRMPSLQWKTWVRLAFVEAGSDWRSLNRLCVEDGALVDYGIAPEGDWQASVLGVRKWSEPSGTVAGRSSPTNGSYSVADPRYGNWHDGASSAKLRVTDWNGSSFCVTGAQQVASGALSVADPRIDGHAKSVQMGVRQWAEPAGVVTGKMFVGGGPNSVADPRIPGPPRFNNVFRIVPWGGTSPAIAGPGGPAGGLAVADPRADAGFGGKGKYRVTAFGEAAGTVIGASTTGQGAFAVADPRPDCLPADRETYRTQGHYGVRRWTDPTGAVPAYAKYDRGAWAVADPREQNSDASSEGGKSNMLPAPDDRLVAVIRALDGTWHRPFTTLELAALQSLVDPEEVGTWCLSGSSDSAWREHIGNAVPPDAAQAIAEVMGRTLLLAEMGETFMLSADRIWVQPIEVALAVDTPVLEVRP